MEITNLTKVEYLSIQGNAISGFSASFVCFANTISQNCRPQSNTNGAAPVEGLPSYLWRMTLLTRLEVSTNYIFGSLPSEIGYLTGLEALFVSDNLLTGSIPSELGLLSKLTNADLSSNRFSKSFPKDLSKLTVLQG